MSEKLYEIKQNSDGKYWLFNNDRNSCLMISENIASLLDICTVLNEQSDTIQGLLLDRNRQEEKLDIARRNLSKQLEKIDEQQATIEQLRTQLVICQQSKSDDGRFQVWEVPPIPKGTRITFSTTTERSDKNE